jgi:hypothetical protein
LVSGISASDARYCASRMFRTDSGSTGMFPGLTSPTRTSWAAVAAAADFEAVDGADGRPPRYG